MRITYYRFPEDMPIRECFKHWKDIVGDRRCEPPADMTDEAIENEFPRVQDCSITIAKKMMKAIGGYGFTQHFDRDGGLFESTEIKLKGNNSTHKYNRHL